MNIQKIYEKYLKAGFTNNKDEGYINITGIHDMIHDIFENGYIVSGYEFLRITDNYTQPFMEYSIWKQGGYKEEDIYNELSILREKISKTDIKDEEIFFDILTVNTQC